MCAKVKYGIWNVNEPEVSAVNALVRCGYAPLAAMVLASRGIRDGAQAKQYLDCVPGALRTPGRRTPIWAVTPRWTTLF